MAARSPVIDAPTSEHPLETEMRAEDAANGVVTNIPPATPRTPATPLPTGFRRLSDARKQQTAKDAYAKLKEYIGKTIQLDSVTVQKDSAGKLTGGTMTFSEFVPDRAEGVDYPSHESPIPLGAIRSIVKLLSANPDETIITDVVQTKRGLSLQ